MTNLTNVFMEVKVVGLYDIAKEKAESAAKSFGVPKVYGTMEELLLDPEVEIVLNLTRPGEHYRINKAALLAGKHVYTEKPLAATYEEGKELVELAKEKGLLLGGAPDTFLGAGIQTCRKIIDSGFIGTPIGGAARIMLHVLEIMTAFEKSSKSGRRVKLESKYNRSAPMVYSDLDGVLD